MLIIKAQRCFQSLAYIELLGSSRYILSKLSRMKPKDVAAIKEASITYSTPRFMKNFSLHLPYGYREEYVKRVRESDLERLAGLIRVCGFLLQTKVYLFCTAHFNPR